MGQLGLEDARRVIAAAERKADEIGQPMNIAVADEGGNIVAHVRMNGAWVGSIDISQKKAYTSRAFDIATKDLAEHSQSGGQFFGIHASNNGKIMIFAGGIPLKRDGKIVGAIGVSGGSGEQDHAVAEAGAAAFSETAAGAVPGAPSSSSDSTLEATWAILRQYSRFEQAVSDRNYPALASVFTPDADIENRLGPNVEGESIEGRFVRRFGEDAPPTKIIFGNPIVDVDGLLARSKVDCIVIEVDPNAPTGLSLVQMGRYYDDWRKDNGTWLIYNRKHVEMNPKRVDRAKHEGY